MGRRRSSSCRSTRRKPRSFARGVFEGCAEGYGFVKTAEGEYFVPASERRGAFDGDVVEVSALHGASRRGRGCSSAECRPAARVVRVVERACESLVGRYEIAEPFGVVVPLDKAVSYDVFTMRADCPHVEDGALVRVRITQFPSRHTAATGVIEEVLGSGDDACLAVEAIVARHKFETKFSEGSLEESRAAEVDAEGALAEGYRDLRGRFVFTIDPSDAKDFDDALSIERVSFPGDEGPNTVVLDAASAEPQASRLLWRLGVHIADVSHYVPWGSSLDLDARRRATSVYLADRVIPMLPPRLSDNLCSLKPGEDRRSMTVDLFLDDEARLVGFEAYPALVTSRLRLTYDEALRLIEGGASSDCAVGAPVAHSEERSVTDAEAVELLRVCSTLAKKRFEARERAGGIDFASAEARVALDEEGRACGIDVRRKNDATALVEEAMILANETVALYLQQRKWPCAYRVHERPSVQSVDALIPVFEEFPWFSEELAARLLTGDPHAVQDVLRASEGRAEGELVSSLLLRSMKRALYRPDNAGHYGLCLRAYCHFTSPIRRYPDLVVHRMLRAALTRRPQKFDQEVGALPWICEHSSDREKAADEAARESQEVKMAEYLQQFVGQSFSAVVSGVISQGVYVRLECTAEGFVPVRALGREYFAFDPVRHLLEGQESGRVFRLGQRMAVTLRSADPRTGRLDFVQAGS